MLDLLISNSTIVNESGAVRSDLGIRDGTIIAIGADLGEALGTIDARDRLVLPGGIDSHVHLDQACAPGITMGDGFESGTRSAV